ncbi:hypothetical protein ACPA5B_13865 [Pseudomonas solani]|uniref:hypothetical protein n=1 Tax=Pseudomonas solani TaxID=2731552 RepID=UPI003C2BE23D
MTPSQQMQRMIGLLSLSDSDYWYDVASIEATELIEAGGEQLLDELLLQVEAMSSSQQEHLAYILGEFDMAGELAILEVIKKSQHTEAAYRARESLYSRKALK